MFICKQICQKLKSKINKQKTKKKCRDGVNNQRLGEDDGCGC